jgi:hypothetical protein
MGAPEATARARAELAAGGGFFLEVEALRALVARRDPGAPAALAALRARWSRDPALRRGLAATTSISTPTATLGAAGLLQQALAPCLEGLAEAPTPAALGELARWLDTRWTSPPAFHTLERLGDAGLAALPAEPAGLAAYLEGWLAWGRGDRPRARAALERAVTAGYGLPRAHLLLARLAMTDAPPDGDRAREHLLAARAAGSELGDLATFWLGWVDLRLVHRPREAEACFRAALVALDGEEVPPAAAPLPTLPPAGPADAFAGPWLAPSKAALPSPFDGWSAWLPLGALGHQLALERGDARGARLLADALEKVGTPGPLLALAGELAVLTGDARVADALRALARGSPPDDDPTWPAVAAALAPTPDLAAHDRLGAGDGPAARLARALEVPLRTRAGDAASAARALARALARDPDDPLLRRDATLAAEARGDLAAALDHARRLAQVDPTFPIGDGDARARVVALVERLVAAPPADPTVVRQVVPDLPADPAAWPAAWADLRGRVRWDAATATWSARP